MPFFTAVCITCRQHFLHLLTSCTVQVRYNPLNYCNELKTDMFFHPESRAVAGCRLSGWNGTFLPSALFLQVFGNFEIIANFQLEKLEKNASECYITKPITDSTKTGRFP